MGSQLPHLSELSPGPSLQTTSSKSCVDHAPSDVASGSFAVPSNRKKLKTDSPRRLVYYAPVDPGGLADYAVCQVRALVEMNCVITVIGYPFLRDRIRAEVPDTEFVTINPRPPGGSAFSRAWNWLRVCRENTTVLANTVVEGRFSNVLISAYSEYLSPFWSPPLRRLAMQGVWFGCVVHDPVRDYVVGPHWWHRWSVSQAYSFVSTAFTHESPLADTGYPAVKLNSVTIPHGQYRVPVPERPTCRSSIRCSLGIPDDCVVVLCFGHIRDEKNLDLLIRAIGRFPDCHLLIAGREQSSCQRTVAWYQNLATSEGVADRCHWANEFIPESDIYKYFTSADLVALTYSSAFRSASGVLNVCSQFGLSVLASCGEGPLKTAVREYGLGEWVEPDQLEAIQDGLRVLLQHESSEPGWRRYVNQNCWSTNANLILQQID